MEAEGQITHDEAENLIRSFNPATLDLYQAVIRKKVEAGELDAEAGQAMFDAWERLR